MRKKCAVIFVMLILLLPSGAIAQAADAMSPGTPVTLLQPRPLCPGGFPTDLSVTNCKYTFTMRTDAFLENSVTDKAMLGAILFGAGAQVVQSPGEWKRTWEGYGKRVGVRYNQAVANGAAEFLAGLLMHDDPRHVSYRDDPGLYKKRLKEIDDRSKGRPGMRNPYMDQTHASITRRTGHAFFDSITDRRNCDGGNGRRLPALSRFAGAYASAYGGYAWYAGQENTVKNASLRAAQSFGTDIGSSFYTEFEPDIAGLLGAMVKRGRQKK